MADFTVMVDQVTVVQTPVAVEMWQLSLEKGDTNSGSRIVILLRAKDEKGIWRDDIATKRVEILDMPEVLDADGKVVTPANPSATMFRELILNAVVSDGPIAQQFKITGLPIRDAGAIIIQALD